MNLMERMRSYVANFFFRSKITEKEAEVGLVDVYLEKILQIVFWESYERTLKAFFILNTLFWLMLMSNLRLYGVLSLLGLLFFIYDHLFRNSLYSDYKGKYAAAIKDLRNACPSIVDTICCLRKDSPVVFYSSMSLFFLMLHMASKRIPGEVIVYLLLMGFFIIPHYISKFKHVLPRGGAPKCILAEDELIPFIQDKDLNKREADLESLLTDRTADSVTNSLVSGISSMPSYLEVAEIPNEIQEEDLIPRTNKPGLSLTPGELSSDSDDSENREIKFDSDHFNTSSSEDDPYSKDLAFPKNMQLTPRDSGASMGMFRSMINTVGGNIVANMFQSAVFSGATPPTRETVVSESDSSDFEIVDANEILDDIKKE